MLKKISKNGFTLVELLVVMAIIAVLISILVVAIMAARLQQRNAQRRGFANNLKTVLEAYYSNQKSYPQVTTTASAYTNTTLKNALAPYWSGTWPSDDPLGQNNRVVYCGGSGSGVGSGRYMLLVAPETGLTNQTNPILPSCSQGNAASPPAGWETFSI